MRTDSIFPTRHFCQNISTFVYYSSGNLLPVRSKATVTWSLTAVAACTVRAVVKVRYLLSGPDVCYRELFPGRKCPWHNCQQCTADSVHSSGCSYYASSDGSAGFFLAPSMKIEEKWCQMLQVFFSPFYFTLETYNTLFHDEYYKYILYMKKNK